MRFGRTAPHLLSRAVAKTQGLLVKVFGQSLLPGLRRLVTTCFPVDQTSGSYQAQAQIQLIVRKIGAA